MSIAASRPRMALVVGGTSGIGKGIALALAKRNVQVTIAGRSAERGQQLVAQLKELSDLPHSFVPVDCFDLESVKSLAENNQSKQIDCLIMTQGMATIQGYTPTKNGIDQKLQLHVFSRLYLAKLLAPSMNATGSRILTVLSAGVHGRYAHHETDFDLQTNYSIKNAADAAGFYTDAVFEQLSMEYPSLSVVHASPGLVNTSWGTEMPTALRYLIRPLQYLFGTSLEDCGETLTESFLRQPAGFHCMDQKGKVLLPLSSAVKHTPTERYAIWDQALALLPDL